MSEHDLLNLWIEWTRRDFHPDPLCDRGFEPEAPALQGRCSTELSYGPILDCDYEMQELQRTLPDTSNFLCCIMCNLFPVKENKGGDPTAGSPTVTL